MLVATQTLSTFPLSVSFIYFAFLLIGISSFRFLVRTAYYYFGAGQRTPIAIYGAGEAGTQTIASLKSNPRYAPKLIIDDDPLLQGKVMYGLQILSFKSACEKCFKEDIDTVLLAIPSASLPRRQDIINQLSDRSLNVKTIPGLSSLIDGTTTISQIQNIDIEDLLEREAVTPNEGLIAKNISDKTVIVTGAGGSIGSELCRQIIEWRPKRLVTLDVSEAAIYQLSSSLTPRLEGLGIEILPLVGSIQDRDFVKNVLARYPADTIYHAAAYKHVPLMEQNIMQCVKNNVLGTRIVVEEAIAAKVSNFTLISTDKAVNPTNFMGASKRLAELVCLSLAETKPTTCISMVRFGNVLGSSGSVVPLFKRQIENGGPVTVTHQSVTRFFMTIPEAAQLVIQASSLAKGGDIFVLDMGTSIKIIDLAFRMVRLSGLKPYLKTQSNTDKGDIAIELTGLRPGEKLAEELTYSDALSPTEHPRIMTASEAALASNDFQAIMDEIVEALNNNQHDDLIRNIAKVTSQVCNSQKTRDLLRMG